MSLHVKPQKEPKYHPAFLFFLGYPDVFLKVVGGSLVCLSTCVITCFSSCCNYRYFTKNTIQQHMLLKTSGQNHKWAIQPHFTTHNNKLNACRFLPEYLCDIHLCLLRNLPSMDNAHTLGHNPIIPLSLHKKGPCCIYGRSPKRNLSP